MKNLSRLTALLLALVMLLSITASATEISNLTKADYDDLVAAQSETVETPSLTATDSGFNFAVSGEVPADAQLYVTYMGEDTTANIRSSILGLPELEEGMSEYAFDITIVENNAEWQPGTPVEVTITGIDTTEDSEVQVYHIPDSAQPAVATLSLTEEDLTPVMLFEEVEATAGEGTVTFMADGFSIYYVSYVGSTSTSSPAGSNVSMDVGDTIILYSNAESSHSYTQWIYESNSDFEISTSGRYITIKAVSAGTITLNFQTKRRSNSTYQTRESITVTAIVAGPVTVTFSANGGSGGPYTIEAEDGAFVYPTLEVAGITPPEGAQFAGWSTSSTDANADVYAANIEGSTETGTTFYAKWFYPSSSGQVKAYFFIRADGEIKYEPAKYPSADYYPKSGTETVRNDSINGGYLYTGQNINNNLSAVAANIKQAPTEAMINTMLTTGGNGGTYDEDTQYVVWYVIKGFDEDSGEIWHVDGVIRDKSKFEVAYHPNGGSTNVPGSNEYTEGATVTVNYTTVPTRTGYVFMGWDEDPSATSPTYVYDTKSPASFTMPAENVDLYAIWRPSDATVYTVQHYLCDVNGAYAQLYETEVKYGTTEATVTAGYKTYAGYEAYPEHADKVQTGIVDPEGKLVLKLYYKEKTAVINYVPVGPNGLNDGSGTVSPTTETVNMKTTNEAFGSTATPASTTYKFVGWYSDPECTQGVAPNTNIVYKPTKAADAVWPEVTTYYAKFEYNLTTLTIKKSGLNQAVYASGDSESAIFTVVEAGTDKTWTIALNAGNGFEVTLDGLTIGTEYTITELTDWTWRYTAGTNPIKHTLVATVNGNIVEFSNTRTNPYWLGGDNYKVNVFGEAGPGEPEQP